MTRCMQPASTASFAGFEARCIGVGVVGGGGGGGGGASSDYWLCEGSCDW